MSITAEQMGAIIRDQRKARNLTQQDLAQAANVTVQAVSKWEIGQSLPDVALLPDIADYLGLTLDALFGRTAREEDMGEAVAFEGFPDDGKLRVAQFLGGRLLRMDAQTKAAPPIPLAIEAALKSGLTEDMLRRLNRPVEIQGSAAIAGDVRGDVSAGGAVKCGTVQGDASAGGTLECETIQGDASAGGTLECGTIQGDASAGNSLECRGDIQGDASAGNSLACMGNIAGDASSKGDLACEGGIDGDVHAEGDVACGGDIDGDVKAGGSVACGGRIGGDVNGSAMRFSGRFSSRDRGAGISGMAHGFVSSVLKSVGIIPDEPAEADDPASTPTDDAPDGKD